MFDNEKNVLQETSSADVEEEKSQYFNTANKKLYKSLSLNSKRICDPIQIKYLNLNLWLKN